ncbi:MAG: pyridoxal phosphate-dependent class II aminotransferase, partial [Desulfacinum sp.]|jgi:threonine-phosphate decarboxylase|nr:pyridoxal phosphate-dependent class II aminotransferase [Desulfacinum sp.]
VAAYGRLQHYPDIHNRTLVDALARRHHVRPEQVVVGNGSTELIYALPRILGVSRVLTALPTFTEYVRAFSAAGVEVERCYGIWENGLQPTAEQIGEHLDRQRPDAVLVTHPGSPSGTLLSESLRAWLVEETRRRGVALVVDEVFIDFCEEASFLPHLAAHPGLVLLRSMTKFYGIPGLRLGYLLASPEIAGAAAGYLPPWSVNTLAQEAGAYCLEQLDYRRETLEMVYGERDRLKIALEGMGGFSVLPGRANYLLVRMADELPDAPALRDALLRRERVLIRECASFDGLTPRDFRIAVRLPAQNDRLLSALRRWLQETDRKSAPPA